MTAAVRVLAQGEENVRDLPLGLEPWGLGVGVFAILVVLLLVTLTFGKDR
jgi:hypothetical protein